MLTSPSCRVPGDRGRRTRPEWRSQWQAHRSKTGKCQTPSTRQRFFFFFYASLPSAKSTPHRQLLWTRILFSPVQLKKEKKKKHRVSPWEFRLLTHASYYHHAFQKVFDILMWDEVEVSSNKKNTFNHSAFIPAFPTHRLNLGRPHRYIKKRPPKYIWRPI